MSEALYLRSKHLEKNKMSDDIEMVYTACARWLDDWVSNNPVQLYDIWDLSQWMDNDMRDATETFLQFGFHSTRARNEALMILRAMYYEYYLFQRQVAIKNLQPNEEPIKRLMSLPQTAQKSAAWHAESRNMLSGHEFGPVCVGSPSEKDHVMAKKCMPEVIVDPNAPATESPTVFLTSEDGKLSAFKWGWRYEPVARQLFETVVANAPVDDTLGRIKHAFIPRLGASPDGLIMDGSRKGRLLEIKCPSSRILDYKVPIHYYCQMQLQAEVCNVEAVEYLEVKFGAYPQATVTNEILTKSKQPWIGKVCVVSPSPDASPLLHKYEYSPLHPNTQEGYTALLAWSSPLPNPDAIVLESCVWYIKDWFHTTVLRNRIWWDTIGYPSYQQFWVDVEEARRTEKYKYVPVPLFVDSSDESGQDQTEALAKDHVSPYNADDEGYCATPSRRAKPAKPVGTWLGVESDPETDKDKTE